MKLNNKTIDSILAEVTKNLYHSGFPEHAKRNLEAYLRELSLVFIQGDSSQQYLTHEELDAEFDDLMKRAGWGED